MVSFIPFFLGLVLLHFACGQLLHLYVRVTLCIGYFTVGVTNERAQRVSLFYTTSE